MEVSTTGRSEKRGSRAPKEKMNTDPRNIPDILVTKGFPIKKGESFFL